MTDSNATNSVGNSSSFSISKLRARNNERRRLADRQNSLKGSTSYNVQYWAFAHELASVITAQAVILGPLERLKIVLQVNPLVKYANP